MPMSNNNENKLVPRLRFPEFQESNEWHIKEIHELSDIVKGQQLNRMELSEIGPYPCLNGGINPSGYTEHYNSDSDTITISEGGNSCGYVNFMTSKFWLGGHCYKLLPKDGVNKLFYYQLLKLNESRIMKLRIGSGLPNIQQKSLRRLKLQFTKNIIEQQKIAACLSSLDEVITAESKKLEALKEHKKGLLQNLFPQQGETVPKLRFKDFEHADWIETSLIHVADYENGKAHEQDIHESGEYVVVNSKFISTDGEVKKFTNTPFCLAQKGDILMVLSDVPNGKAIAKCFLVEEDNRYTVNQRICKITPNKLNSKILYYLLNRNPYFLAFDDGVKQTNLRKEDVLDCPIMIPENQMEQEKIADCLSSLDELITAQTQKIELLQQHKKGLLQGLFP